MINTNDDIEEPVKKSGMLLFVCLLVLAVTIGTGIYLLVEALQKPASPEDVLDMRRMMISGIAVILFSLAIIVFLLSVYKPDRTKKSRISTSKRKPVKRKSTKKGPLRAVNKKR